MATKIEIPRQKMLKDFLQDNNLSTLNSCSSNGFKSYPRTISEYNNNSVQNLLSQAAATLPRSRSKSRAAAEVVFRKLLNAVKSLHYSGSSTPLTLPRSVSRRFLRVGLGWSTVKKKREKCSSEVINSKIVVVTVKVKDILRWKSFRDLVIDNGNTNHDYHNCDVNINDDGDEVWEVMEESQPLDCVVGPTIDAPKINGDFTVTDDEVEVEVEELPCWSAAEKLDEVDDAGVSLDTHVGPKKDNHNMASEEDIEQQSPVSVLESPFRDEVSDEEFLSPFDQSLANMERTKQRLLQSIQLFESLAGVHEEDEPEEDEEVEECEPREEDGANEAKSKGYLSRGLCWFRRGGKGLEEKIECVTGMDEQRHWGKFEEERIELGVELEVGVLSDLLDEILIDFFG